MFERFTQAARSSVIRAQSMARVSQAERVEPVHLLAAVTEHPDTVAVRALEALGVSQAQVQDAVASATTRPGPVVLSDDDADALRAIGIDLDEVLRQVDENLGSSPTRTVDAGGRSPRFAKASKKVLELALREAIALKHNYIGTEHILLGLLRVERGEVVEVFQELGVTLRDLRVAIAAEVRRAG